MTAPLRVAVLGAGTVGREVVLGLLERAADLRTLAGAPLELAGVAVRDVARAIARGLPADLLTDAPAHLVAAPTTDVIVELMGGEEPARTLIAAALESGRAVVTSNKRLVARHGPALEAVARRTGATLRFEAAVGGGIPLLGPLASDLAANRLDRVRGIVNGTTNFILSAMTEAGRPYGDVLADAQAAGYAEADPSADVEGHDALDKLILLARLAFGRWLDPGSIALATARADGRPGAPGITGVTAADVSAAGEAGLVLKLIALAERAADDPAGLVAAAIRVCAVPAGSAFARTSGPENRIEIEGRPIGRVAFSGPGAGGPATSSAVIGDLLAIARHAGSTWAGLGPASGPVAAAAVADGAAFAGPSGARYPIIDA